MQTFLPYADFASSAQCLDNQRLGKQRVECLQILNSLKGLSNGWKNHPATKMWCGYENALCLYGMAICNEWVKRGFRDNCFMKIYRLYNHSADLVFPGWLGDSKIHASHRSNLIRKNRSYYQMFGWTEADNLEYCWPN